MIMSRDEREGGEGAGARPLFFTNQLSIVNCSWSDSLIARPHPNLLPQEKGQRLHASLYAVVRRANPVAGASCFLNRLGSDPC
jgi:hypothetical protein